MNKENAKFETKIKIFKRKSYKMYTRALYEGNYKTDDRNQDT